MTPTTLIRRTIWASIVLTLLSCGNASSHAGGENVANGTPQINFESVSYDFGTVMQGEKVSHTFRFRNIGDGNLTINDVTTSCGCTASRFSIEPIAPGGEGQIEVIFDSYGRHGKQQKKISVWTNCSNDPYTLKILTNIESPNKN